MTSKTPNIFQMPAPLLGARMKCYIALEAFTGRNRLGLTSRLSHPSPASSFATTSIFSNLATICRKACKLSRPHHIQVYLLLLLYLTYFGALWIRKNVGCCKGTLSHLWPCGSRCRHRSCWVSCCLYPSGNACLSQISIRVPSYHSAAASLQGAAPRQVIKAFTSLRSPTHLHFLSANV
ncbi:hypothetical protein SISSUDRAFT_187779 [Sistotremastrum suecicum HHB10207 ss-3]|uniref:Uncharacterized protein n=1 Tax=Sistotremastrum suecicum HHB10207 ss-3 TaxID=1314776 RepID=A0A166AEW1_9AGAM|nr:hypothetical protein SISSUDRAFT_187779 [Sistotremastrum suecicum HHB10207 ss-3]